MKPVFGKAIAAVILVIALALILIKSNNGKTDLSAQELEASKNRHELSSRSSKSATNSSNRSQSGKPNAHLEAESPSEQVMMVSRKARAELEKMRPSRPTFAVINDNNREQVRERAMSIRQLEDPAERQAAMAALQEERQQQMQQRQEEVKRQREEMRAQASQNRGTQRSQRPEPDPVQQRLQQTVELENLLMMGRRLGASDDFDTRLGNFAQRVEGMSDDQLRTGVVEFQAEVSQLRQTQMQSRRKQRGENPRPGQLR